MPYNMPKRVARVLQAKVEQRAFQIGLATDSKVKPEGFNIMAALKQVMHAKGRVNVLGCSAEETGQGLGRGEAKTKSGTPWTKPSERLIEFPLGDSTGAIVSRCGDNFGPRPGRDVRRVDKAPSRFCIVVHAQVLPDSG